jgi:hypothetical protein
MRAYIERKIMIYLSCLSSDVWNFSWCFEVPEFRILRFLVEPIMICGTLFGNRLRRPKIKWEIWEGGRKHGVWVQLNQGTVQ